MTKTTPKSANNDAQNKNTYLNLSFTFKGKTFCLCVTQRGTSNRNFKKIEGLINPNFQCWDRKRQAFYEATEDAIHNNNVLQQMKEPYQRLINQYNPQSAIELFALYDKDIKGEIKPVRTLGDFVEALINAGKKAQIKNPAKTYQQKINLLHKLQQEGQIINKPIEDIDNKDFIAFGKFILGLPKNKGQSNFINIMKYFKEVHSIAVSQELNDHILKYKYTKDAPVKKSKEKFAFTNRQYQKFVELDLNKIPQSGCNPSYYKELYRDFCILMYETMMRPVDALRLHTSNIKGNKITYVVEKKKNYQDERKSKVTTKIKPNTQRIIAKYKGKSTKGYIFPFAVNEHDWDFTNSDSWNKWNNRKQKQLEDVNTFLHKVEKIMGINDTITNYSFRHTAFTHAVNKPNANLMLIAKEGGTSVKMLEQHYYHQQY